MLQAVVTNAFGPYQRGDVISDPKTIQELRASANAPNVVVTQAPDVPAPAVEEFPAGK